LIWYGRHGQVRLRTPCPRRCAGGTPSAAMDRVLDRPGGREQTEVAVLLVNTPR
jgi:hypothetical protein